MMLKNILLLCLTACMLTACGGNASMQNEGSAESEGMKQFAENESFKAAHDEPDTLIFEARGSMTEFSTPGGQTGNAYLMAAEGSSNKYLFVIHEWWGLNEHIKAEAERLYDQLDRKVTVMALDIYDGKVASSRDEASQYMQSVSEERAKAIIRGAMNQAGEDAQIASVGWCFGGGWSLKTSIMAGERGAGCVMYYGMPVKTAKALQPIQADILGIFARQDGWINEKVVNEFKEIANEAGADLSVHWFDAGHAFANPSSDSYREQAAQEANQLAWDFLREKLL